MSGRVMNGPHAPAGSRMAESTLAGGNQGLPKGGFEPPEHHCLLLGEMPQAVRIDGRDYAISSGFRHALLFEGLMLDDSVPAAVKARQALRLFYPVCPENQGAALEAAQWFWRRGAAPPAGPAEGGAPGAPVFDWAQDAGYLCAAFMADYHIDLTVGEMHWWKFCALLEGLRPENLLCRIIEWRGADLGKLEGEARSHCARMKRRYALRLDASKDAQWEKVAAVLAGDGDLQRMMEG